MCTTSKPLSSRKPRSLTFSSSTWGDSTDTRLTPRLRNASTAADDVVVAGRPVAAVIRSEISTSPPTPLT